VSAAVRSLLQRRLVIVTGKGGTGKTSVVAALALAAARHERRVVVVEMGLDEQVPRLFDPAGPEAGYAGRVVHPGVTALRIDPYAALAEYLGLQIGGRRLVELVLRNRAFRQLMDASPGWRELITLGKVWHLEQMRDGRAPRFDLLLVDAPATGHGLTFLDVPRVAVAAVRMGPLRRHASWVEEMIRDEDRTLLLPVTLAEELPARETAELIERAREQVGIAIDRVVVNAVAPEPFPPELPDLDARLARLPADLPLPGLPRPAALAACAAHLRERHALNQRHLAAIGHATGLPLVALPLLPEGVRGPAELTALADVLLAGPPGGST
jgi:anion-transporting  ArsA/GET3 family ATPase